MSNINDNVSAEDKANFRLSVVGYLTDWDENLMLVRQKDDTWGLPAGRVRFDEDPIKGIVRECVEETGLENDRIEINFNQTRSMRPGFFFPNLENNRYFIGLTFSLSYDGVFPKTSVVKDEDITEARSFSVEELMFLVIGTKREDWYKSEYDVNRLLAISWIVDQCEDVRSEGNMYMNNMIKLLIARDNIPGLFWNADVAGLEGPLIDWRIMCSGEAHKIWETLSPEDKIITSFNQRIELQKRFGLYGELDDDRFYEEANEYLGVERK